MKRIILKKEKMIQRNTIIKGQGGYVLLLIVTNESYRNSTYSKIVLLCAMECNIVTHQFPCKHTWWHLVMNVLLPGISPHLPFNIPDPANFVQSSDFVCYSYVVERSDCFIPCAYSPFSLVLYIHIHRVYDHKDIIYILSFECRAGSMMDASKTTKTIKKN